MLHLDLPIGREQADRDVLVTVRPLSDDEAASRPRTQEEWEAFVERTAGKWQGEPLERPEQGEYEERRGFD